MQKQGQSAVGVGVFIVLFITIIVGVILLIAVAQSIGETQDTRSYNSSTVDPQYTAPADTVTIDLEGQELLSTPTVINGTAGSVQVVNTANYTIDEGISATTGVKTIQYTAAGSTYDGALLNISYDYGTEGYIESSSTRSIVGLITIFFALAIAIIALEPTIRSGVLNAMGK